jgi:hypothetical protein
VEPTPFGCERDLVHPVVWTLFHCFEWEHHACYKCLFEYWVEMQWVWWTVQLWVAGWDFWLTDFCNVDLRQQIEGPWFDAWWSKKRLQPCMCCYYCCVKRGEGGVFGSSENSLDHDMWLCEGLRHLMQKFLLHEHGVYPDSHGCVWLWIKCLLSVVDDCLILGIWVCLSWKCII